MSLYYIVKLYQQDPRAQPDYLGERRDGPRREPDEPLPLGVVTVQEAKRFLWVEEATAALVRFMEERGGNRIVRGQVFHIKEEPVGDPVIAGKIPSTPRVVDTSDDPPDEDDDVTETTDVDEGERLWLEYENSSHEDQAEHVTERREAAANWFFAHAEEIFAALRSDHHADC